jgi:hypothetical protein
MKYILISYNIQLDTMNRDDLVKLLKKYITLQKQYKTKNEGIFFLNKNLNITKIYS